MTDLAAYTLEVAETQLHTVEDPPRSNRGPQTITTWRGMELRGGVDNYIRAAHLNPEIGPYAWCAAFGGWCIQNAAAAIPVRPAFKYSARCYRVIELNQALLLPRAEVGAVGIHLHPNEDGHWVFATAVNDDLSVQTIEGNTDTAGGRTGGQVMRQVRAADYIHAWLAIR